MHKCILLLALRFLWFREAEKRPEQAVVSDCALAARNGQRQFAEAAENELSFKNILKSLYLKNKLSFKNILKSLYLNKMAPRRRHKYKPRVRHDATYRQISLELAEKNRRDKAGIIEEM
jgi:hypothetical protein